MEHIDREIQEYRERERRRSSRRLSIIVTVYIILVNVAMAWAVYHG